MEIKKYIIPIVVILAFLSGALLNSGSKQAEKELEALRKKERVMFQQQIIKKQIELQQKDKLILAERNKRNADSLQAWGEVAKRDRIIIQMKKRNENRSFDTYSDVQLDSLRTRYYVLPAH